MNHATITSLTSSMGQSGFKYLTTGQSFDDSICRMITVIERSVLLVSTLYGDAIQSITFESGSTICGLFTNVICVSGKIIAYKDLNKVTENYVSYNGEQLLYNSERVIYGG